MSKTSSASYDLIIVGAGMIGSALAICLRNSNLKIAVVESREVNVQSARSFDDRNLVLSLASQRILHSMQLWQTLVSYATPINKIHVSEQDRYGAVNLTADDFNANALAFAIKARDLAQTMHEKLGSMDNVELFCPATVTAITQHTSHDDVYITYQNHSQVISASLVVLADGTNSFCRQLLGFECQQKQYHQQAIVSNVVTELPLNNTAYERFSSQGPMALLPTTNQTEAGLVFCVNQSELDYYLGLSDEEFLCHLTERFSRRLGRFLKVGTRSHYPLSLLTVETPYKGRSLLMGNAAHTIHPNAAQGFNLGLRDVACLSELLTESVNDKFDIGSPSLLQRYEKQRLDDQTRIIRFTDGLAEIFYNDDVFKKIIRGKAMALLETLPPLKRSLMVRAMGLYGNQANMVKQVA